jgi:hypothetical protein
MSVAATSPSPRVAADPFSGLITQLVLRCGRGDEAALGELFDLTFFLVAALVNRPGVSLTGVDDEVVEAFWRIWRGSAGYEPNERGVLAWLLDQALGQPVTRRPHGGLRVVTTS